MLTSITVDIVAARSMQWPGTDLLQNPNDLVIELLRKVYKRVPCSAEQKYLVFVITSKSQKTLDLIPVQ